MSSVRTQKTVMAGLDKMNGRAVRAIAERYDRDLNGPARDAVRGAKSLKGLKAALTAALVKRMDVTALEEALVDTGVGAAGVGVVSASPKRRSDGATKRRRE